MSDRRQFLQRVAAASAGLVATRVSPVAAPASDRPYWVDVARRLGEPVLTNLAARTLKARMPVETQPGTTDRASVSHLEAIGRLLSGLGPWLEHGERTGEEGALRARFAELARESIDAATDPSSPDRLNFDRGSQPLVDAAFLGHACVRAPSELWQKLRTPVRANLANALRSSRVIKPYFSNWLLFSAMVEAALCAMGEPWDATRVDYAIRQHEQWYKGDGIYGDGPEFHWDYYNSYVIQPMLLDVLATVSRESRAWDSFVEPVQKRARRYAAIQERLIGTDGSFPAIGRSLAYRAGAFQLLAQVALMRALPDGLPPAQVRCALSAAIRRTLEAPGTFDRDGWLTIGLCGHQPGIGETYISTGSLYLCATALLPLGLPAADDFWTSPARDWTAKVAWSGGAMTPDHAL